MIQNKPAEYGFDVQWVEKKATEDWEKESLQKLYILPDKTIYQPADHIEGAMRNAAKKFKVKGQRGATYSKLFGSMISIEPDAIEHQIQVFETFKKLVVIPSTRGRVMRYRPIFKDWSLKFQIIAEEELSKSIIKEVLESAGKYIGIGDWRPEKAGKFGKFQVTSFHEVT